MTTTIGQGQPHIVIAERQDQITGVMYSRKPTEYLALLASATHLGRTEVRPSRHAPKIVKALASRFSHSITDRNESSFWTAADYEELIAALDEFDLDRGVLIARAGVKLNDLVEVAHHGRGRVTGFTICGRVMVRLEKAGRLAEVGAIAPRSMVKPVIRAPQ